MIRLMLLLLLAAPAQAPAQDCAPGTLRQELLARQRADQDARSALAAAPHSSAALDAALRADADNTAYMRSLVAACGWPKRSEVGEDAAKAAWLLTQHADMDPEYQVLGARQMKYAVLAKEADPERLALLVDRNRRLNDQPQVYGMQTYVAADGALHFHDIVTPGQLETRRRQIGLGPFYCWALEQSAQHDDAPIAWPSGVLVHVQACPGVDSKNRSERTTPRADRSP